MLPALVGFFFSLGHSTIVVLLSVAIALTAARILTHFPHLRHIGGLIGTCVSAAFLLVIVAINLLVLRGVVRAFASVKRGEPYDDQNLEAAMAHFIRSANSITMTVTALSVIIAVSEL